MDYKFHFGNGILYLEFKIPLQSTTIEEAIKDIRESFPNTNFEIVAYKNIIGYWEAYHLKTNTSIYCGSMSLKDTREKIKKYLENEK